MLISWDDIIARARVYLDDDHRDDSGWLAPGSILAIAQAEYRQLYSRWVRSSLIAPAWIDHAFVGPTCTVGGIVEDQVIPEVLTTIGIAEDLGAGHYRLLQPSQSRYERSPTFGYSTHRSNFWYATGTGNTITYTLEPQDTSNYFVRYIPVPQLTGTSSDAIDVPIGGDERLVLGVAQRAHLKDSGNSALLNGLIQQADQELAFQAFGRVNNDSPRVRRNRRNPHHAHQFPTMPSLWFWN